jgi:hypothetical protein
LFQESEGFINDLNDNELMMEGGIRYGTGFTESVTNTVTYSNTATVTNTFSISNTFIFRRFKR